MCEAAARIKTTSLTIDSRLDELKRVWLWVEDVAQRFSIPEKTVFAIQLCLEEVISNTIRHGYQNEPGNDFSLTFEELNEHQWAFIVEDNATPFSPLTAKNAALQEPLNLETLKPGGLGIPILHKFTQSLEYQELAHGNRLRMTFKA